MAKGLGNCLGIANVEDDQGLGIIEGDGKMRKSWNARNVVKLLF
jgi:hypothetical protein